MAMAVAATVSPLLVNPASTKLLFFPSSSSLPPNRYSLSSVPSLHLHYIAHRIRNPRLCSRHAKLNSSRGEEQEGIDEAYFDGDGLMEDESDEDDEDTESSLDLLFRFLQSMFRKVSRRARKASRSVLPDVIPPQLVAFAVDGVLLLTSLSVVKALLEVVCTLGGTVFVVILLLRVIWAAIAYFQSNGVNIDQTGSSYGRTQPVT